MSTTIPGKKALSSNTGIGAHQPSSTWDSTRQRSSIITRSNGARTGYVGESTSAWCTNESNGALPQSRTSQWSSTLASGIQNQHSWLEDWTATGCRHTRESETYGSVAVTFRRQLATTRPAVYTQLLGTSLVEMAAILESLGRLPQADIARGSGSYPMTSCRRCSCH